MNDNPQPLSQERVQSMRQMAPLRWVEAATQYVPALCDSHDALTARVRLCEQAFELDGVIKVEGMNTLQVVKKLAELGQQVTALEQERSRLHRLAAQFESLEPPEYDHNEETGWNDAITYCAESLRKEAEAEQPLPAAPQADRDIQIPPPGHVKFTKQGRAYVEADHLTDLEVPPALQHLFDAKLLGFGDADRVRLCESCLNRAIGDDLVVHSSSVPIFSAAPPVGEQKQCQCPCPGKGYCACECHSQPKEQR